MVKKFDIVVLGASGFTGKYVAEELARVTENKNIKWAVAGRNETRIRSILKESAKHSHLPFLNEVPVIIADVTNQSSLNSLAESTKLLINVVGPYQTYGEQVINACIEGAADCIDISGEPIYLESMQLKYNDVAKSNKLYFIGACGADSLPAELGVIFTMKSFKGSLNEIESYLYAVNANYPINVTTAESALIGLHNKSKLVDTRKLLFSQRLPRPEFVQPIRGACFKSEVMDKWTVVFPGSDRSVVNRTQRCLFENDKIEKPVQYAPYWCVNSLFQTVTLVICGLMLMICSKSQFLIDKFLKFPGLFSLGNFSSGTATRSQINNSTFQMEFIGKGWKQGKDSRSPPEDTIRTSVKGPEFGYLSCAICAVQAAFTILEERKSMPNE
ncbi:hypothetical protein Ciccas_003494 [Cichlidogyrus casuarinus]|uniref:Saccharopine dehydrogenase NADP binding domain-containing protein n=1 Tax=Cichlidogyrus casuarinus TaxID=1844966 RepID=A0ABD2QE76_9PLAT